MLLLIVDGFGQYYYRGEKGLPALRKSTQDFGAVCKNILAKQTVRWRPSLNILSFRGVAAWMNERCGVPLCQARNISIAESSGAVCARRIHDQNVRRRP